MLLKFSESLVDIFNKKNIYISNLQKFSKNINFPENAVVESYACFYKGDNVFSMGAFSYCFSSQFPAHLMKVGRYCSIAEGLKMLGHHHPINWLTTSTSIYAPSPQVNPRVFEKNFELYKFPNRNYGMVTIGNDVWIGSDVLMKGGINIGTGAVILAGSVVVKDVPPYAIIGGNPAKIIRFRFDENTIEKLLATQWWEYNIYDFSKLDLSNPLDFLEKFDEIKDSLNKLVLPKLSFNDIKNIGIVN